MLYGTATFYQHLRFEPPTVDGVAPAGEGHRHEEASYVSALDAALGGAAAR
jgi:hypothetical protein